ncbi:CHASE2 domain-containing protein [Thermoleptolyngbya sichuanensis XZ-Cy5]|uniref:CHASE2 domain-containing protein n=1 Tax=Thermoleptolyngbya sichuanensis TaxID=2885951 RepID=UPI00240D0680|nr:CHASE2 domain-containing protein [Thermoleptolyngbya sichuanensis]MDG2615330.1 CHASE2 domain-containing protein [Thermoleptolyngbya sichuanensis XZ-Cy5]
MTPPSGDRLSGSTRKRLKALRALAATLGVASLVVTGAVVAVRQLGLLQGTELDTYDALVRRSPDLGPDERLLVVGISDQDIQSLSQPDIHDGTLAEALQNLEQGEPRVIALDVGRDLPVGEGREELLRVLQQSDRILAACTLTKASEPSLVPPPSVPDERVAFADLPFDPRGIIRRASLVITDPLRLPQETAHRCNTPAADNPLVSLGLSMALFYLQDENITAAPAPNGEIQLGQALLKPLAAGQTAGYRRTGATDYQIMLRYRSAQYAAPVVSLMEVLQHQVPLDLVRDRMVIIGYTSSIKKDLFQTPYSGDRDGGEPTPGAILHAQIASHLVSAAKGERALVWYWPLAVEMLWMLGWSLVGGAIAWLITKAHWFLIAEGVAVLVLAGLSYLLFLQGGWVPLAPAAIALLSTALAVVILDRATKGGYTEALFEQMKEKVQGVIKPTVEIDQEKRARQVAEITESSYFKDLQQRAREIRERRAREGEDSGKA